MSDIKFHYQRTGIPVSPPEVILSYEKYKKLRSLLMRAKAMLEIGMPHLVELIEEIAEELGDAPTLER